MAAESVCPDTAEVINRAYQDVARAYNDKTMKLILVLKIILSILTFVSCKGDIHVAVNNSSLRSSSNSVLVHPVTKSESDWAVTATSVRPSQDLVDLQMLDTNFGKNRRKQWNDF
jgi:hypothetical protein